MWRKDDVLASEGWRAGDRGQTPGRMKGVRPLAQTSERSSNGEARGLTPPLRSPAAQDKRGVGAAEAERVGEGQADLALLRLVRHEVDGGLHRWIVEVERRRGDIVAHGQYRVDRLDCSCRTQEMPDRRLGGGHRELARRV